MAPTATGQEFGAATSVVSRPTSPQSKEGVGLRRVTGVEAGVGGEAFAADADGRRLIDAGIVSTARERLTVTNPMLTDEVLRVVLGLDHLKLGNIDPMAIP
jgi:hypothetical protein